ncbi:P-loop NTPase fold protein [Chitinophagaceae bacterium LWZ2-11]
MEDIFNLDTPIDQRNDDRFQRYEFSKRIANIINKNKFSRSSVIGIYGKWGEGKTSVLNFISNELDNDTIKINFNPWYFQEDRSLIKSFFESIAATLGKKLSSKTQEIAKAFEDYSDSIGSIANIIIPFNIGSIIGLGKNITSKFKNDSLEYYKKRIEKYIIEADTNFVIFIDDIDRLNIDEVQSVFKLVKLVGDFSRFSYVLAFDDDLIASSLGHKFAGKQKKDGYDFLEKIIQLPLTLPQASLSTLKQYSLELISNAVNFHSITLSKEDIEDFRGKYDSAFVPSLKNPRLAKRLANTITFSIPLLYEEVNISDLIIIECIKVFYPELYYFIRHNSSLFLRNYTQQNLRYNESNESDKKIAIEEIDKKLSKYDIELVPKLKKMLCSLFPQLETLYYNSYQDHSYFAKWYQQQRICSPYYFERYFSYVVKTGDISDVYFKEVFSDVGSLKPTDFANKLMQELKKIDINDFLFKLGYLIDKFSTQEIEHLYLSLSMIGKAIPDTNGNFLFSSVKDDVARIITTLIEKLDKEKRIFFCSQAIKAAEPLNYWLSLYYRFTYRPQNDEDKFITLSQVAEISNCIVEKFNNEIKNVYVFNNYSIKELHSIIHIYKTAEKTEALKEILNSALIEDHQFPLKILKIFSPVISSSAKPYDFNTQLTMADYNLLSEFLDISLLYKKITGVFGDLTAQIKTDFNGHDEVSDKELVCMFQSIYQKINAEKN